MTSVFIAFELDRLSPYLSGKFLLLPFPNLIDGSCLFVLRHSLVAEAILTMELRMACFSCLFFSGTAIPDLGGAGDQTPTSPALV